ncbi:MAG: hypothetical protein FWD95_01895 [Nocardioidaceae bacterium]|nr:hypothetical protein [Nocardioidaceae bacterium]
MAGICARCLPTEAADTRPAATDALTGGRWVTVRGIRRWLSVEAETAAYERRRARALLAERYDTCGWWTAPEHTDDPQVTSRRLAEAMAEYDAADGRRRESKRGAAA